MKILLTNEEPENYFFNSLCNALSYVESGYDLELVYHPIDYVHAQLKLKNPSYEEILIQILKDGGKLTMKDKGCDGEYTRAIILDDVHERVQNTMFNHLMNMINENDDAETGDVIIQQVFFNEVIFG